jgi:hypothetical protein
MRRFRFNIASLLAIISILGVGFAALRESSDVWESGVFTLTLAALLISILLAIHQTEKRRAFWLGFALIGRIYLGLSLVPSIESRLINTKALAYLASKVPGRSMGIYRTINSGIGSGSPSVPVHVVTFTDVGIASLLGGWSGTTENFVRIGHSLMALLVVWLGGQLSRRLYRSSRSEEPITAVAVEGIAR